MQYKIARALNTLFFIITGIIIALWAGYFFFAAEQPAIKTPYLVGALLISVLLLLLFLWLEQNWDKRVITGMAKDGKIALANIKSGKSVKFLRDSAFNKYWLYEFQATIYDREHKAMEKTFYEKMRHDMGEIPRGSVYVTYDEAKPGQIFIIPNVLISHLATLAPVVNGYEEDKRIDIKYLDAFYHKGMVLRTFKDALKEKMKTDNKED